MRRLLLALLLLVPTTALAQVTGGATTRITAQVACEPTLLCDAKSPQFCSDGVSLYLCDTTLGYYRAVASTELVGDPVTITGSLAVSGDGSAGAIDLEEAAPGTDVGTLTVGTLSATRTYTFPDLNGTVVLYSASGSLYVASGSRIGLEGLVGDTYIVRDADTGNVLVYRDGSLRATISASGVQPGACPSNLRIVETGYECVDSKGRRVVVTAAGATVQRAGMLP